MPALCPAAAAAIVKNGDAVASRMLKKYLGWKHKKQQRVADDGIYTPLMTREAEPRTYIVVRTSRGAHLKRLRKKKCDWSGGALVLMNERVLTAHAAEKGRTGAK